jgi:hypothetical protein
MLIKPSIDTVSPDPKTHDSKRTTTFFTMTETPETASLLDLDRSNMFEVLNNFPNQVREAIAIGANAPYFQDSSHFPLLVFRVWAALLLPETCSDAPCRAMGPMILRFW